MVVALYAGASLRAKHPWRKEVVLKKMYLHAGVAKCAKIPHLFAVGATKAVKSIMSYAASIRPNRGAGRGTSFHFTGFESHCLSFDVMQVASMDGIVTIFLHAEIL